jgi:hypothetical protein
MMNKMPVVGTVSPLQKLFALSFDVPSTFSFFHSSPSPSSDFDFDSDSLFSTEFTIPSRQLFERITSKTNGCLTRLLELGVRGLLDVHNEISRSELVFGDKIGDGTAGSVYRCSPHFSIH